MPKKGKKKGTVNGVPITKAQPELPPGPQSAPQVGKDESPETSEPAEARELAPEGDRATALPEVSAARQVLCQDWTPIFHSSHWVPDICSFLLFREIAPLRAVSRLTQAMAEPSFEARWARMFPCPWAAGYEDGQCRPGEVEKEQDEFSTRIDLLEKALSAMADGDSPAFCQAATRLGTSALSMLNMASFCDGSNDRTLLHYAAIRCDMVAARWLLRRGASPNVASRDTDGYGMNDTSWTPLHHAARNGDAPMCKLLLSAGADASAKLTDPDSSWARQVDSLFRSLDPSRSSNYRSNLIQKGSTAADVAALIKNQALAKLLYAWPEGAQARARPRCLAPESAIGDDGLSLICSPVAAAIEAAVADDRKPLVFRPRHKHCRVPGPLCPAPPPPSPHQKR